jgi:hypothetical protein
VGQTITGHRAFTPRHPKNGRSQRVEEAPQ